MRLPAWFPATLFGTWLALGAPPAHARVEGSSGFSKAQTFSAAVRLLRVDRGYEIVEKDADAAYLLFKYPVPGQKVVASGSMEVVETRGGVRIIVTLPRLPEYHEAILRDALLKKLEAELGPPRVPEKPAKPAEKPAPPSDAERGGSKAEDADRKRPSTGQNERRPDDLED